MGGTINGQKERMRTNTIYPFQKEVLIIDATSWPVAEWKAEWKEGNKKLLLVEPPKKKNKGLSGHAPRPGANQLWIILNLIKRY